MFMDVGELAGVLDVFSMVDVLDAHGTRMAVGGLPSSLYPEPATAALTARAISAYCRSRAPSRFRPTRKPVAFAVTRIAAANRRFLVEDGLGLAPDLGLEAVNSFFGVDSASVSTSASRLMSSLAPTSTSANVTSGKPQPQSGVSAPAAKVLTIGPSERALTVIPFLGLVSRTLKEKRSQQRFMGITPRVEALVLAATSFGSGYTSRSDGYEILSAIGSPATAAMGLLAASRAQERSSTALAVVLDAQDAAEAHRRDETVDGVEPDNAERTEGMLSDGAMKLAAGMVIGEWQASAALNHVDVSAKNANIPDVSGNTSLTQDAAAMALDPITDF
jgi:hypothetical protein